MENKKRSRDGALSHRLPPSRRLRRSVTLQKKESASCAKSELVGGVTVFAFERQNLFLYGNRQERRRRRYQSCRCDHASTSRCRHANRRDTGGEADHRCIRRAASSAARTEAGSVRKCPRQPHTWHSWFSIRFGAPHRSQILRRGACIAASQVMPCIYYQIMAWNRARSRPAPPPPRPRPATPQGYTCPPCLPECASRGSRSRSGRCRVLPLRSAGYGRR